MAVSWTLLIGLSILQSYAESQKDAADLALQEGKSHLAKDVILRKFVADVGGIYVASSAMVPPNPHLASIPDRDILTPSGKPLTMMNPAYVIRTLQEYSNQFSPVKTHITSLKPTRPETAPDEWEKQALSQANFVHHEFSSYETRDNQAFLRVLKVLETEPACLKCHAHQGYKAGDIRGGISVSVPMAPYKALTWARFRNDLIVHSIIWIIGLLGLHFANAGLKHRMAQVSVAEADLRKVNEQMQATMNALPDLLFELDHERRFVDYRASNIGHLYAPPEKFLGKRIQEVLPPNVVAVIETAFREAMKTGEFHGGEYFLEIGGKIEWHELSAAVKPGETEGKDGLIILARNITERKIMEEELRRTGILAESANRAKSEFLANISHEIRTPLNSILGFSQLLIDEPLTPSQKDNLQIILSRGKDLLAIINDILDLARMEADMAVIVQGPFRLRNLLKEIVQTIQPQLQKKALAFTQNIESGVPDSLVGDSLRLKQILWNLLGNSAKFTDQGKIEIHVSLEKPVGDRSCKLRFTVTDTGPGIPRDWHETIFAPFTQVDGSNTRKFGGTGLGLTICKRLVDRLNGKIWVESEPGKGSVFHVVLDFEATKDGQKGVEKNDLLVTEKLKSLRVLVGEDDPASQKLLHSILAPYGSTLTFTDDGEKVVSLVGKETFDLLLLDIQMPNLEGFEVTRRIRTAEKERGTRIPIIAVTAHAMAESRKRCLEVGMDDCLTKPFSKVDLFAKIMAVLNHKEAPPLLI